MSVRLPPADAEDGKQQASASTQRISELCMQVGSFLCRYDRHTTPIVHRIKCLTDLWLNHRYPLLYAREGGVTDLHSKLHRNAHDTPRTRCAHHGAWRVARAISTSRMSGDTNGSRLPPRAAI